MNRKAVPWIVTAVALVLLGAVLALQQMRHPGGHPDPRVGVTAEAVLPGSRYAGNEMAVRAYAAAAQVPQVLDGLYCYCECKRNFNHRSLLTCFESVHGAECDVCISEAFTALRMHQQGASLDAIRQAIDAQFGS